MADEPKKIDLEQTPAHPPDLYEDFEESRTTRRGEHPDSRRLRLAQEQSKIWREEQVFRVRELYLKPISYIFLLGLLVFFLVVLARPKSPAPLQEVAKGGITLLLGAVIGFVVGKTDKPNQ